MSVRTVAVALLLDVPDEITDEALADDLSAYAIELGGALSRCDVHPDPDVLFPTADQPPERLGTPCTSDNGRDCTNPDHDHGGQIEAAKNGTGHDTGDDFLVCGVCSSPMHYDYGDDQYRHDTEGHECETVLGAIPRPEEPAHRYEVEVLAHLNRTIVVGADDEEDALTEGEEQTRRDLAGVSGDLPLVEALGARAVS